LEHNLAKLLKGTDNKNFQMALEQALFLADVLGYANAEGKLGD
jgi:phage gp29-like protein